jgi:predicted KAP-like P-loop ATPase
MFLVDHETPVDLLYYDAIAEILVRRVSECKAKPITVGVHGDWGAGKSSVLAMAEARFRADNKILCIKFNGWQFQGFEDAKAALIESIITELRDAKKENAPLQAKAATLLKRVDYLKIAKKGAPWIASLFTGIPHPQQFTDALAVLHRLFGAAKEDLTIEKVTKAVVEAEGFLKPESEKKIPEQVREFHKEFDDLIKTAGYEKLVVLIDDLDRCLPKTAIETLEAIRLFLFGPQTAFIIAADEAMIEYAVRQHFPDLPSVSGPMSYARYYLEKLIQVPFRIPALGYAETQTYIALVLAQAGLGEDNPQFAKLLPVARQCLSQPWNAAVLDQKMAKKALFGAGNENLPSEISHAITLSQQIARILTDGSKGNPRQIKRFLNSMLLRNEIAGARGFGAAIKQPILAKVMLAESFNAGFYDQLTRASYASTDGKPKELASLEKAVRLKIGTKEDAAAADEVREAQKESDEWAKSEWITTWAKCDPALADVDLRPYIFVTRDKRSYFGGAAGTNHLDPIVDALLGKELAVKSIEPQLSKLTPLEAEQVFDAVQSRITQADDYSIRPAGLIALTRAKPTLQRKLFMFLRDIPPPKVHGWVTTGFDNVFTDAAVKAEFATTIEKWAQGGQSPKLSAAVKAKRK